MSDKNTVRVFLDDGEIDLCYVYEGAPWDPEGPREHLADFPLSLITDDFGDEHDLRELKSTVFALIKECNELKKWRRKSIFLGNKDESKLRKISAGHFPV